LPTLESGRTWRHWIDTALASPEDIVPLASSTESPGQHLSGWLRLGGHPDWGHRVDSPGPLISLRTRLCHVR
jgi:hypothetical protein